jgi:phosphosulfolactate phosphohydrolase-like enzyme
MMRHSDHGRILTDLGFEDDVAYCAQIDVTTSVPRYDGSIVALERAAQTISG